MICGFTSLPVKSGVVSKCDINPIVGTLCGTLLGNVAMMYALLSMVTSCKPICFSSSTKALARSHCLAVLGVVSLVGSLSVSTVT